MFAEAKSAKSSRAFLPCTSANQKRSYITVLIIKYSNSNMGHHLIYTPPYGREFLRGLKKPFLRGCVHRHPLIFAFFLRGKAKIS